MKTKNGAGRCLRPCGNIEKPGKARPAHFHVHTAPSSAFVRFGLFFPSSEDGVGATKTARVRERAPRSEGDQNRNSGQANRHLKLSLAGLFVAAELPASRGTRTRDGPLPVHVGEGRPQGPRLVQVPAPPGRRGEAGEAGRCLPTTTGLRLCPGCRGPAQALGRLRGGARARDAPLPPRRGISRCGCVGARECCRHCRTARPAVRG